MKLILSCLLLALYVTSYCQVTTGVHNIPHAQNLNARKDTVIESDTTKENKEPQYFYATLSTTAFVNTKGTFGNRFVPSIEIGRTYGIFDLGLATGRTNTIGKGSDTTHYIELRPTINIFSKGRFAEGLCLGAGYIFGAKQALLTEICNSINFNITERYAIAIVQGYEFFDGSNDNTNRQYMGLTFTYNFLKSHSTNLRRKRAALISDK
ncbi:hypothetical protein [Mucilaginibacter ginkgonis]|uniref:Outer membrane protein with beta-barrel domain n=1 Tax=Mucilaginibacter ginkgonis TaxID=2682091 RepID=A0A6I4HUP7_9SPHI|nr:hypothetical protein [Mucilaginibacter ginkgonis]QQL50136.1 hypothetical protein GO620_001410 [Mucilaginibacter ginkgonis]